MIKLSKINDLEVVKDWGTKKMKPLNQNQIEITGEDLFFPNIIITSQKGSGKTVLAVNLIKKMAIPPKTKIVVFSTTFSSGDDNSAFDSFTKKFPSMVEVYPKINGRDGNILAMKIEKAKERYETIKQMSENGEFSNTFPNYIFLYDDLSADDMKDETLDFIFRTNRHYGVINILIEHRLSSAATPVMRDNSDIICVFGGLSLDQINSIYDMVNLPGLTKKEFDRIYQKATETSKSFLFINKTKRELRKNLNEIISVE